MGIKINGEECTPEEAKQALDREDTIVTEATVHIPRDSERKDKSDKRFDINEEYFFKISKFMDESNAAVARVTFSECGKFDGKSIHIFMTSPSKVSGFKFFLFRLLQKLL